MDEERAVRAESADTREERQWQGEGDTSIERDERFRWSCGSRVLSRGMRG